MTLKVVTAACFRIIPNVNRSIEMYKYLKLTFVSFVLLVSCQKQGATEAFEEYYPNGSIKTKANKLVKSGKFHGQYLEYDSIGGIAKEVLYDKGVILEETLYYPKLGRKLLHVRRHDTLGTSTSRFYEHEYGCMQRKFFLYKNDYLEEYLEYHCPSGLIAEKTYIIQRGEKNVLFRSRYYNTEGELLKDSSALHIKEVFSPKLLKGDTVIISLKPRHSFQHEYPDIISHIDTNSLNYRVFLGNYDRGFYTTDSLRLETIYTKDKEGYITFKHVIKDDSISYVRGALEYYATEIDYKGLAEANLPEEMKNSLLESDSIGKSILFEFKYHVGDSSWH